MKIVTALTLAVPLLAATGAAAQTRTEGNTGAGAAMSGAQSQSSGLPGPGSAAPQPNTHSPRPAGAPDTAARRKPEGNLGAGAAMSGAQSQSMGAQPNSGGTVPAQPTQSPGGGQGSRGTPAR